MQQFAQSRFPEVYEEALVPRIFQPWAEHLIRATNIGRGDRVLDVACGTGIVARLAREQAGPEAPVVGVDLSPGMLAVARRLAPDVEWREGDAATLPLRQGEEFTVVICQQGLQFFSDRAAAAAGMRRALSSGGRIGVSTWRSEDEAPVLLELRHVAEKHVGPIVDRRHSFPDSGDLETLLVDAGFDEVRVQSVARSIYFDDGPLFIHLNAMALVGMGAHAKEMSDEARAEVVSAVVADSLRALEASFRGGGLGYTIGANVATARG
jgi:ubiquinone/menaquinone biosynthesis C-methylase UbiE